MAYRSELEAARARVTALEERVRELEAPGRARRARVWVAWAPAAGCALLTGVAFGLAMSDVDEPAWVMANVSAVAGIFASLASWGHAGRAALGWALALLKAALPVAVGWGWWSIRYAEVHRPFAAGRSTDFFWYVPSLLVLALVLEGVLLMRAHRKRDNEAAEGGGTREHGAPADVD
jgi:hypothetical protein